MGHFYVWKFPKHFIISGILLMALLCSLFLYLKPLPALSVFKKSEPATITKGNTKENNISLTFNISWGDTKVYDILDVLKKEKIRATFFVSGEWAERHPQILEDITEGEHEIGMLGYRYKSYLEQDIEEVQKDIQKAIQVFNKLGFNHIVYIRPPSGLFNKDIIEAIEQIGLKPIHWSIYPEDAENRSVKEISSHLIEDVSGGDIVLLHASDAAMQTAEALETVIPSFRDQNLEFVTLSELVNEIETEEKLIE